MYQNPTLFPAISNREAWQQIVKIADGDTGDLILLTDGLGAAAYAFALEIMEAEPRGGNLSGYGSSPWLSDVSSPPEISASLADYIAIVDTGTIHIQIPKSVINSLRPTTYDVFLTISPVGEDDGRQLLIGRLPVLYGGRNT